MIKIYNSYSQEKEEFKPINPDEILMYVCGPTVYNYIHIGNARSAIAFDTIRKYLEYRGYKVKYVSNFTDVDDKMIKQAKAEGITIKELADRYIEAFNQDTKPLNIAPATIRSRATDVIEDIIEFIQELIAKDMAYVKNADVFFRAKKAKDYAKLSHQHLDELITGASGRISDDEMEIKEDPLDFVLWKAATLDDTKSAWMSPWGLGRPGWHIECSVMSTKYLDKTIDIHGGGIDLMFPHHTNEIAQSESHSGQKFVNYWMHNQFVNINEEKMSKSLGNFVTVHDLLKQYPDPLVIRFFMSKTHYRRAINYSLEELDRTKTELDKIKTAYKNLLFKLNNSEKFTETKDSDVYDNAKAIIDNFTVAMDDDFNVSNGLVYLYEFVTLINKYTSNESINEETANYLIEELDKLLHVYGLDNLVVEETIDDSYILEQINLRNDARKNKYYQKADEIRELLAEKGIILEDTVSGTRWHKE